MSPIELIREGIIQADWQKVCDGFAAMSGIKLEPPKRELPNRAAENTLLRIAQLVNDHYSAADDAEVNIGTAMAELQAQAMGAVPPAPVVESRSEEEEILKEDNRPNQPGQVAAKLQQQQPVVDQESVRARQLKDTRASLDMDKFRVNNQPRSEKGKEALKKEWVPPNPAENRFTPDPNAYRKEAEESKKMSATAGPKTPRPEPVKVKVECSKCHREEMVEPILAPRRIGDDNPTSYVCNGCIKRNRRSE